MLGWGPPGKFRGVSGPSDPDTQTASESELDDPTPARIRRSQGLGGRVGRYLILEQVGAGGAGLVCRAYDPDLDRQVAIKVLNRPMGPGESEAALRLKREAQAIARLDHPNVVAVYDVGEHDGEVFIAMELVDGGSLKTWLQTKPSTKDILRAFVQAGRGLSAAHAKGIIHRDFKPSNVLVGRDEVVRVADFGLARGVAEASVRTPGPEQPPAVVDQDVTASGAVLGTPAYMAPEQSAGEPVDARADQYAFCLALGEAVAGVSGREAVSAAFGPNPPRPVEVRPTRVPKSVRQAIRKGISARPDDRFDHLDEVVAILDVARQREGRGRQALTAVVLFVLAAVGAVAYGQWNRAVCADPSGPFDEVWSADKRAAVRAGFEGEGGTPAGWEPIERGIQDYRRAWVAARRGICEATHVRGEQSAALLDLRMQCLDGRLDAVRAVLDLLPQASVDAQGATDAVLRLPEVAECATLTAPQRIAPQPKTAEARKVLAEVNRDLRTLEAMFGAGLWEEGLARSATVLEAAEGLSFALTRADALAWRARFLARNDRVAEAKAHWLQSALHADAARDDERRFVAHLARIALDDGTRATRDDVARDVSQAEALRARLGRRTEYEVAWMVAQARMAWRRGRHGVCRDKATRALELLASLPHPRLIERLDITELLGSCLELLGQRRASARIIEEALAATSARLGARHPKVARLYWQLSRARSFIGDEKGAQVAGDRALTIATETLGPEHSLTGRALHALSNVDLRAGRYDDALPKIEQVLAIYKKVYGPRSRWVGQMLSNMGLLHSFAGRHEASMAAHREAVGVYTESLGRQHAETGAALGRQASALHDAGAYEAALPLFEEAMRILRAADPTHARLLDQIRGWASCQLAVGRPKAALQRLEAGLTISAKRDEAPVFTARLEFLTARALWAADRDRTRARALAESALGRLNGDDEHAEDKSKIQTWLRTHSRL